MMTTMTRRPTLRVGVVPAVLAYATAAVATGATPALSTGASVAASLPAAGGCALTENFDAYPAGSVIVGQGGWESWDNDPTAQFGIVTPAQSRSAPHSLEIDQTDDIVHQFAGINSGQWTLELHQFIPAGSAGEQYVILLNQYIPDGNPASKNWSTQILANSTTGLVTDFNGAGSTPIVFNQWVPIRVDIDLDADTQVVSYNGVVIISDTWTGHVPPAGTLNVAALDLFSNGATRVFYDDISLCPAPVGAVGACCFAATGHCLQGVSQGDCELQGGEYLGDDSECDPGVPCGVGACCFMGQCLPFFREQDCGFKGGIFLGSGSTCDTANCLELGACCLPPIPTDRGPVQPDPSCCITTEAVCLTVKKGIFLGVGVPCAQITLIPLHDGPPSGWSHIIRVESNCPEPRVASGGACVDGPYKIDPWITNGSLTENCHDFSVVCPIPADFFGPGSDPFIGTVCFKGEPIGDIDLPGFGVLNFGEADTLIRRESDPFDACDLPGGPSVDVPIELVALNLVSIDPVIVTFNGGQNPEPWDVQISVDPTVQPGGTLTATKTHCNGGTFDSSLDVCPTFTFTRQGGGGTVDLDYCASCNPGGVSMEANGVGWVTFIRDNLQIDNPVCSDFTAGVEETEPALSCDCNLNGVFDAAFNPCDPRNDCDRCGDTDGDGAVTFGDLLEILGNWGGGPRGDTDCNGLVDFQDILRVLGNWD